MNERYLAQIKKINDKVDLDSEFPDWNKAVQFNITEGGKTESFHFVVDGGRVTKVDAGALPNPDVIIEGSEKAIAQLFDGQVSIVGAFITKEVTITGAIGDALGAKVLLDAVRVY